MEDNTISFNPTTDSPVSEVMPSGLQMQFEQTPAQPAKIKVIGVGGGGGNAVNHMFRQGIRGVDFIVCNTDAKALASSPVPNKIELAKLGAGNKPEIARKAALEHKDEIRNAISDDTQMLFITAGMGGGTGTGAAPVIAEIAKSVELADPTVPRILVVAIVTMPFSFEGKIRRNQAVQGIEELKKHVDAILVINNDKLRLLGGNLPLNMAFSQADDVLLTAAKGIAEIITVSGHVNIDFRDVNTVMEKSGTALMGAGEGRGENRARQAIEAATTSVLLDDNDIRGAKNILLYFSYNKDHQITMDELGEVTDYLTELTGNDDTNVIWGDGDDDSLNDELRITLIATGFVQRPSGPTIIPLPSEQEPLAPQTEKTDNVTKPAEEIKDNVEEKKDSVIDDPIDQKPVKEENGRRVFILEPTIEDELEERMQAHEASETQPVNENKPATENSHLDEIRVITRDFPTQPRTETPNTPHNEAPRTSEPTFHINTTDVLEVSEPQPEPEPAPKVITAEEQLSKALAPSEDDEFSDLRMKQKAERIRRMNALLHDDPNGARIVEEMTTEQLTGEAIYETPHSAESDASRPSISAFGTVSPGMDFLNNLPD